MSLNPFKGMTRKSAYSHASETYIETSWTKRIAIAVSILAVLALALFQTLPEQAFSILIMACIVLFGLHMLLRYPNIVKVIAVWFFNELVIASFGSAIAYFYEDLNEQFWNLITWVGVFTVGSLLVLVWNLRLTRGKIWFTLALSYAAMQGTAIIGVLFMLNPLTNAVLSTGVAFIVVILRYVFPRRKNWENDLPQKQTLKDAEAFISNFNDKERARFHIVTVEGRPFVVSVSTFGHIYVTELVKTDQPFTNNEGEPQYHGRPIAGWLADSYLEAKNMLPKGTPFIHIIAPVSAYTEKVQTIEILPRNSVTGKPYVTFIVGQKRFQKAIAKLTDEQGPALKPATTEQLKRLKKKFT